MRILELEIINFGKFNHETVTFHDGMNLIYGENEMGKTTLHSFIRGMFFGIEKQRGRAARKDEYSIREPWFHAGQFAGIMRFESGGKIFRLERNFYRKEKSVSLVCETNGEVLSVEKGDLQVLMEGMNEDAFRNTVFFNQQSAATDEGLARELRNYMTNLQNSGDGEMNVSAAIKSLESQRRHLESEQKRLDAEQAEELESQQMRLEYVRQELLELGGGRGLGLATPQTPTATTLSVMGTGTPMQQLNMNPLRTLTSGTLSVTPHYVAVSSQRYVDRHGGDRGRVVDEPRSAADKHVAVAREQSGCVLELQEQRETDLCVKRTNKPHRTLHGLPATVLHAQCQRRGVNGLRLL